MKRLAGGLMAAPARWWAVLCDTWGCVYPGCGATFDSYVALQAHMSSHYG